MMRRTLSGPMRALDLGGGSWRLTAGAPDAVHIYLKVTDGTNCATLLNADIRRLDLVWHDDGITVHVTAGGGVGGFEAVTVIIHEAQNRLYDALPLAGFDAKARRFWKRVFLLIRVPGGRHLLRLIARRQR